MDADACRDQKRVPEPRGAGVIDGCKLPNMDAWELPSKQYTGLIPPALRVAFNYCYCFLLLGMTCLARNRL